MIEKCHNRMNAEAAHYLEKYKPVVQEISKTKQHYNLLQQPYCKLLRIPSLTKPKPLINQQPQP